MSPLLWNSWCQDVLSCLPFFSRLEYLVKLCSYAGKAAPLTLMMEEVRYMFVKKPKKIPKNFCDVSCQSSIYMMFWESIQRTQLCMYLYVSLYVPLYVSNRVWCTLRHCPGTKTYSAIELPCSNYFLLCRNNTSKWLPRVRWWLCGLFLVKVRILTF